MKILSLKGLTNVGCSNLRMENLSEFYFRFEILVWAVLGYLGGLITTYLKERFKNRAAIHDLIPIEQGRAKIEKEKELEITLRKYQYDDKRNQYTKFFNMIDAYHAQGNDDFLKKMVPAIEEFSRDNSAVNHDAISKFATFSNNLIINYAAAFARIKNETNTIKLIASDEILNLLDKFNDMNKLSLDKSIALLSELVPSIDSGNVVRIEELKDEIDQLLQQISIVQKGLLIKMKEDLRRI